jgi:hypothetical protein
MFSIYCEFSLCLLTVYFKIQKINGVFFFLDDEFYTGLLFVQFGSGLIYVCLLLVAKYEDIVDVSEVSDYLIYY